METLVIDVDGMSCTGCEERIKKAVSKVKNVKKVEANYKTGIVKVHYKGDINTAEIVDRINDLGYSANV